METRDSEGGPQNERSDDPAQPQPSPENSGGYFVPQPTPPVSREPTVYDYARLPQPPTSQLPQERSSNRQPRSQHQRYRHQSSQGDRSQHHQSRGERSRPRSSRHDPSSRHRSGHQGSVASVAPSEESTAAYQSRSHESSGASSHNYVDLNDPGCGTNIHWRPLYVWAIIAVIILLGLVGAIIAVVMVLTGPTGQGNPEILTTGTRITITTQSTTHVTELRNSIRRVTTTPTLLTTTGPPPRTGTYIMGCDVKRGSVGSFAVYDLCWSDINSLIIAQFDGEQIIKMRIIRQTRQCAGQQVIDSGFKVNRLSCDNKNDQVYVIDHTNFVIKIYNTQTGLIVVTWHPREVRYPQVITTNRDYIVLGNHRHSTVYLYSKDSRKFIRSVDIHENLYRFNSFHVNDYNTLLITTWGESERLIIYDLNKDKSIVTGAKGSSDDRFDAPLGATQTPDGAILVADKNNNRVSVWSLQGDYLGRLQGDATTIILPGPPSVITDGEGTTFLAVAAEWYRGYIRIYRLGY